jgi:hypothetical protein
VVRVAVAVALRERLVAVAHRLPVAVAARVAERVAVVVSRR